jgi:hypothetical protein
MISFKEIEMADREIIQSYTLKSNRQNCDLSFSNLCSWRFLYNTQYAVVDGFLIFKFRTNGKLAYMIPTGEGDLKGLLEQLAEDAEAEEQPLCLMGILQEMKEEIEALMSGKFVFNFDRDYADYIYLRSDLATLRGKKFQSKRNFINRFRKEYKYEYSPITPERIRECLELEAEWYEINHNERHEGSGNERRAITYALYHFEELGLQGGILRVEGRAVAFTFGMPINHNTFGVHVEKADSTIEGAYATINYEFVNHIPEQYTYINREEDLGIEGLRKAKLSYQPVMILEKATLCFCPQAVAQLS